MIDKETKKLKKKSKKSKKKQESGSETDEDARAPQVVNKTMELPEGASLSDNDDKNKLDPNDPHLALDIDLDDVGFYAAAKSAKVSTNEITEPARTKEKSHHRKKKDDEPVLLIEESEKKKKKDKKHKRKKEVDEMNLLEPPQGTSSMSIEKSEKKVKKAKKKSSKKDDDGDVHSKKKIQAFYDEFSEELWKSIKHFLLFFIVY